MSPWIFGSALKIKFVIRILRKSHKVEYLEAHTCLRHNFQDSPFTVVIEAVNGHLSLCFRNNPEHTNKRSVASILVPLSTNPFLELEEVSTSFEKRCYYPPKCKPKKYLHMHEPFTIITIIPPCIGGAGHSRVTKLTWNTLEWYFTQFVHLNAIIITSFMSTHYISYNASIEYQEPQPPPSPQPCSAFPCCWYCCYRAVGHHIFHLV